MSKIKLPEQNKIIELRSYKAKDQAEVEKKQQKLAQGEIGLHEFRKYVVGLCYPEFVDSVDDWPAADLSYLVNLVLRYSVGGPDAVKNSLVSGSITEETV